jgi:hypothetical protein
MTAITEYCKIMGMIESVAVVSFKQFIFLADFKVTGILTVGADDYYSYIDNDGRPIADHYSDEQVGTQIPYLDYSAFKIRKDLFNRDIEDCFPFTYDLPPPFQPHQDLT